MFKRDDGICIGTGWTPRVDDGAVDSAFGQPGDHADLDNVARQPDAAANDGGYGWNGFGEYFEQKKVKLMQQNEERRSAAASSMLKDVVVYIDGWVEPPAHELKRIILENGGYVNQYPKKTTITHVIAQNLTQRKFDQWGNLKVVTPQWIMDSLKEGKLLPWTRYRLVQSSASQNRIDAFAKAPSKSGNSSGGAPKAEGENNEAEVSAAPLLVPATSDGCEPERNHSSGPGVAESADLQSIGVPPQQSTSPPPGQLPRPSSPSLSEQRVIHTDGPDSPTEPVPGEHSKATSPGAPGRPAETPTKQGSRPPSNPVSPAQRSIHPELQSEWARKNSSIAPDFLEKFYGNSRLHHISTAKISMQEFVRKETEGVPKRRAQPGAPKTIMHVDMDCFFVSVALSTRPEFAGLPAAVCHARNTGTSTHSEIASCNYPARAKGLRNGMWTGEARRLCPELVMLPYEFEQYTEASEKLYRVLISEADEIQANSVDEAFIDVSSRVPRRGEGKEIEVAEEIRQKVREATGVTCSIGVGESMLAARLATKKAKPDGSFFLAPDDVSDFIVDLPADGLPGVGRETAARLAELGAVSCGDLRALGKSLLQREFGEKTGTMLYDFSRGVDTRKLKQDPGPRRTVSAEANWGVRFEEVSQAERFIAELAREVAKRMAEASVRGRNITLKMRKRNPNAETIAPKSLGCGWSDSINRSVSLLRATGDGELIGKECVQMFRALRLDVLEIRGVGISISKLEPADGKGEGGRSIVELFGNSKGREIQRAPSLEAEDTLAEEPKHLEELISRRGSTSELAVTVVDDEEPKARQEVLAARAASAAPSIHPESAEQIDESVLRELPPELQAEVFRQYKLPPRPGVTATGINPFARTAAAAKHKSAPAPRAKVPEKEKSLVERMFGAARGVGVAKKRPAVILRGQYADALPSPSQIDPQVLAELPESVRKELEQSYRMLKRPFAGMGNDDPSPPPKKQKGKADEPVAASVPAPKVAEAPSLMGATDLDDVRKLIREWIASCPEEGPLEEDCETFVVYCAALVRNRMLDVVESVASYIWRHAGGKDKWVTGVRALLERAQVFDFRETGVMHTSATGRRVQINQHPMAPNVPKPIAERLAPKPSVKRRGVATQSQQEESRGIQDRESKRRRAERPPLNIPDLAEAILAETVEIHEKDAEELELELELFGGDSLGVGLGQEGSRLTGADLDEFGLGFTIDRRASSLKASKRSTPEEWSDDDESPEELPSSFGFVIDRKGNEKEKVDIRASGHVRFGDGEQDDEEEAEDGESAGHEDSGDEEQSQDSEGDRRRDAGDASESSGTDDESSMESAGRMDPTSSKVAQATRKPAWTDPETEDAAPVAIGLTAPNRVRKLRENPEEESVPMDEYERRLRNQFEKTHGPKPEWAMTKSERAELIGVKRKSRSIRDVDSDVDNDGEEGSDEEGIEGVFRRTGAVLSGRNRLAPIPSGTIGVRRMRDANWMGVSEAAITTLSFHPSSAALLTTSLDRTLRIFSINGTSNPSLQTVSFRDLPIRRGAWSADGREVFVGGRRPFWYAFDVESGTVDRLQLPKDLGLHSMEQFRVAADGKTIAVPGRSGHVHLLSTATKRPLFSLQLSGDVRDACYSPDGKHVFGLSGEGELYSWDLGMRKCTGRWKDWSGQGSAGGCVQISPDGSWVVTGNDAGLVNVYSLPTLASMAPSSAPTPSRTLRNLTTQISLLHFHPTASLLLLASNHKRDALRLANTDSQTVYKNWPTQGTPLGYVQSAAFGGRRGEWLAVGDVKGKARLWGLDHFL
ncbi:hypothetical protein DFJ74DRAFT_755613 [Hyaloraphidium curvatum]|nr:hypothetical protein DFJ74DRAFT_755613 [Hyaloraphidium curvatum]